MSFKPNEKLIKREYEINSDDGDYLCCWSETLKQDVYLYVLGTDMTEDYEIVASDSKPNPYEGSAHPNQDWMVLTRKEGGQKFWTGADQFTMTCFDGPIFISNNGLDIDVDSIECGYNIDTCTTDLITYSDPDGNMWEMGRIVDEEEGKVELYSHVESIDPTDTDEDGDDVYMPMPQDAFALIKQLFEAAGFKVKIRRCPPRQ